MDEEENEPALPRYDEMAEWVGLDLAARFLLSHLRVDCSAEAIQSLQADPQALREASEEVRQEIEAFCADFPNSAEKPGIIRLHARLEEAITFLESRMNREEGEDIPITINRLYLSDTAWTTNNEPDDNT